MKQESYETAILAMSDAIKNGAEENVFQRIFEDHPVIMQVLGYDDAVPHPVLPITETKRYIPDFIGRRRDGGLADLIDLKLPKVKVLLGRERREAFTAEMSSYVSQMWDYQDYFDEQSNRQYVRDQFEMTVPSRPNMLLIAGISDDLDRSELHRQIARRPGLNLVTFDDVLRALELERGRHYGQWEGVGGLAFYALLRFGRGFENRDRYWFEAEGLDGFRVGVCVNSRSQLVLRVHSPMEGDWEVAGRQVDYDRWITISALIGAADSSTLLQLRVDDAVIAEQRVEGFDPGSMLFEHMTMGADRAGENCGVVDLVEHVLCGTLPDFQTRLQVADYFAKRIAKGASCLRFSGAQWMATDGGAENAATADAPEARP